MTAPPALPSDPKKAKSFKRAVVLNFFLPGAGLVYAGQRASGLIISFAFAACLISALAIFLVGYFRYISLALSGDILEGDNLESIPALFHTPWLFGLLALSIVILITSMILLYAGRKT